MEKNNSKPILADSDALIAIAKPDDINHAKAISIKKSIVAKDLPIALSPFTIPEVVTVLSNKVLHEKAISFLEDARKQDFIILPMSAELEEAADSIFANQKKKGTSYFDCYNMAILQKFGWGKIFSFDKVYKENSFEPLEV